jgi:hypothetical protein
MRGVLQAARECPDVEERVDITSRETRLDAVLGFEGSPPSGRRRAPMAPP